MATLTSARTFEALIWIAVFYILAGGFIALNGLRPLPSFGYGTQILLLPSRQRRTALADALARQELMNQTRHIRNEASYQSLRKGLRSVALFLFAIAKFFPAHDIILAAG